MSGAPHPIDDAITSEGRTREIFPNWFKLLPWWISEKPWQPWVGRDVTISWTFVSMVTWSGHTLLKYKIKLGLHLNCRQKTYRAYIQTVDCRYGKNTKKHGLVESKFYQKCLKSFNLFNKYAKTFLYRNYFYKQAQKQNFLRFVVFSDNSLPLYSKLLKN